MHARRCARQLWACTPYLAQGDAVERAEHPCLVLLLHLLVRTHETPLHAPLALSWGDKVTDSAAVPHRDEPARPHIRVPRFGTFSSLETYPRVAKGAHMKVDHLWAPQGHLGARQTRGGLLTVEWERGHVPLEYAPGYVPTAAQHPFLLFTVNEWR